MSEVDDSATFFGLSRVLDAGFRSSLDQFLRSAWHAQYGAPPGALSDDLEQLAAVFRPTASGARLRAAAAEVWEIDVPRPTGLPDSFFIEIDVNHGLVTAEGRLGLELLLSRTPGQLLIEDADLLSAGLTLARFYGVPTREAVLRAVARPDLRPLSFAFALLLLINGSEGEERALRAPNDAGEQRRLMQALGPALDAFSVSIGGKPLTERESQRMEGNWVLTEVARQLPTVFAKSRAGYWVRPEIARKTPQRIGELLRARKNSPTEPELREALQRLEVGYRRARPALAALAMAHDKSGRTETVLASVIDGFRGVPGAGA